MRLGSSKTFGYSKATHVTRFSVSAPRPLLLPFSNDKVVHRSLPTFNSNTAVRSNAENRFRTDAIETAIRQELGMQSTKLPDGVRDRVEAAIEKQRFRGTVGEIAAAAGLKLSEAEDALKALAYDSQAVLQVSSGGDVVYAFSSDFRGQIRSKGLSMRAKPVLAKAQKALSFLVRITFGTALFASIAITALAITVLLSSQRSSDDDRRGGGRGGGGGGMFFFPDLFMWSRPGYSRPRSPSGESEMSLPEAIFSFVFGDGDPNEGYDEQRWRALGRFIQGRNGVVTAEEMAPFLDPSTSSTAGSSTSGSSGLESDDSYVLPALIKFGGEPLVDDEGHLLYRFPDLQKTVLQREVLGRRETGSGRGEAPGPSPQYEQEKELTAATPGQLVAILGLGVLNVVGVVWLDRLLGDPVMRDVLVREGLAFVVSLLPALKTYAAAYFAIPSFRYFTNMISNQAINMRNDAREKAALELSRPLGLLASKLASARMKGERKFITKDDIVFTTENDAGQQANMKDVLDWDQRLEGEKAAAKVERGGSGW